LSSNLNSNANFEWFKLNENTDEFEFINGTDSELEVTESGTYKLIYNGPGNCDYEDQISVQFIEAPTAYPIADIEQCATLNNGQSIFDLSSAAEQILGDQDGTNFDISFHLTQSSADENINRINSMEYTTHSNTIVARIAYANCYNTTTFNLITVPSETSAPFEINGFEDNISVCVDEYGNLENPIVLGNALNGDYDIKWFSNYDIDVNSYTGEEYTVTNLTEETIYTLTLYNNDNIDNCALYTFNTIITPIKAPEHIEIEITEPPFSRTYTLTVISGEDDIENYQFQLDQEQPQSSNIFYNVLPGMHTINVISGNCINSISEKIQLVSYPRFFTPNGDGENDFWNIADLSQEPYNILIFNRYGKLIKSINTQGMGWDGTFSGKALPQDDYWFIIEYKDPNNVLENEQLSGHFTLKR